MNKLWNIPWAVPSSGLRYGAAILACCLALVIRLLLSPILGEASPFIVFTPAVLFSARYGGLGPGLLTTFTSVLSGAYVVWPHYSVALAEPHFWGQIALFILSGSVICWLSIALRSAQQSAYESKLGLRASQKLFQLLVDSVQDYAIFMIDSAGYVVTWNAGAERIKGYRVEEIIGKHFSVFYPPEDIRLGKPEHALERALTEGRFAEEGWRVHKNGARFWANIAITVLRDDAGQLRGLANVTRDVTERKRAEQEILQLNESLERRIEERTAQLQEVNQALEAFSFSVSHDLRAPVRSVQGFAQALQEDYADRLDGPGRDYIQRIITAARRMDFLIQDLLAYSRLSYDRLTTQSVDLSAVVADALAQLEAELRLREAQVVVSPLPRVRGHRTTLVQVVLNLITNAVKFVAPGTQARVQIYSEERAGRVRLLVEDNGIGIAPEHQPRIFNVFERLHSPDTYAGSGLGLAIVQKAVERMGGRVGVESEIGKGSRFWIELPKATD